ncbi:MAG: isocitrate/isopropylmalate family dehydrogenase, partial [Hyphomicrobiaceae bacterium]
MATHKLLMLPGDGIGPEVMAEVERVVAFLAKKTGAEFQTDTALCGGCSIDKHGMPLTPEVLEKAKGSDAIIFGSVGGPKWDKVPYEIRPEAGILKLRTELDLFANLRPAICYPALAEASSLKRELVEGLDILILRELTGGTYFGEPKEIVTLEDGQKRAVDTTLYTTGEIARIARAAFELARKRGNKVHSA